MPLTKEADAGLKLFDQVLRETGCLKLCEARPLSGRFAMHVVVEAVDPGAKKTDIVLSFEFLSDLPNTPEYQLAAKSYARRVAGRTGNPHLMDFYCKSGIPIGVEIEWPLEHVPQRAASFLHVSVHDRRNPPTLAIFSAILTHQQYMFDLRKNPFNLEAAIINTARRAVDAQKLKFYDHAAHPRQLQELPVDVHLRSDKPDPSVDRFIAGKVYWMGFKQGDRRTRVWVADDADADYLGTNSRSLIQTAQILEAQRIIVMDPLQEYASAGEGLLGQAKSFETGFAHSVDVQDSLRQDLPAPQEWDVFICHASEDKDDFVRPLAGALQHAGLRVWYDEFTLDVGDSLRQEIDRGLANSRYGIVVLSPAFFSKNWPQWELNGLVAREVAGRKVILPVWHNVTAEDVRRYSPPLADKVAANAREGIPAVVARLLKAVKE